MRKKKVWAVGCFLLLFLPFLLALVCVCVCAPGCLDGHLLRLGEVDEGEASFDYMTVLEDGGVVGMVRGG